MTLKPEDGKTPVLVCYDGEWRECVWNGEPKRKPKKGEIFISGAMVHGYVAQADLPTEYYIATLLPKKE